MVLNKEEFLASLKGKIGEDTSDEALKFLEDMTDTYDDLSKKSSSETEWQTKYNELDKSWRKKYTDRFFNAAADEEIVKPETLDDGEGDNTPKKFTDLFSEKEN